MVNQMQREDSSASRGNLLRSVTTRIWTPAWDQTTIPKP